MDGTFMNQIFGSEFIYGIDLGEGESQTVEFNSTMENLFRGHEFEKRMKTSKEEWKSKAEEVKYEDC